MTIPKESPIEVMSKERRNQSFKQHEEVELLEAVIKKVNRRMWFHVHSLRRSSNRLFYTCLVTGVFSFVFLLFGTSYPDEKISIFPLLCTSLLLTTVLFYLVYRIVKESWTVEKTYRRRYIKEGERQLEEESPDPKGLQSIVQGDEAGVVYYLRRQLGPVIKQSLHISGYLV